PSSSPACAVSGILIGSLPISRVGNCALRRMAASGRERAPPALWPRIAGRWQDAGAGIGHNPGMAGGSQSLGDRFDVAVIGAGAAGIGAARRLQAKRPDLSLVVLEAASRVGGRAWTITPKILQGGALDLGCGWLHGARTNAWTRLAR